MRAAVALALAFLLVSPVRSDDFAEFSSAGLPGSEGVTVRVRHPSGWKRVASDDDMALAELRGPHGRLTGILQIGRGSLRPGMQSVCDPQRARTMLQNLEGDEADARITDVVARSSGGRPGFEMRYERNQAPDFLLVRSMIVCLGDSRILVSCGAMGTMKASLADIEPTCRQVLESVSISETP